MEGQEESPWRRRRTGRPRPPELPRAGSPKYALSSQADFDEVAPISTTRTLYDYTAQTEEELSFSADLAVDIYDKDDPDWFLVRLKQDHQGTQEYGFVPSNYLDDGEVESAAKLPSVLPAGRPESIDERRPLTPPVQEDEERDEPISPSNAVLHHPPPPPYCFFPSFSDDFCR